MGACQKCKATAQHLKVHRCAGYPGEPHKFEERVAGLLAAFHRLQLPKEETDRSA